MRVGQNTILKTAGHKDSLSQPPSGISAGVKSPKPAVTDADAISIFQKLVAIHNDINRNEFNDGFHRALIKEIAAMRCVGVPDHAFLKNFYCDVLRLTDAALLQRREERVKQ